MPPASAAEWRLKWQRYHVLSSVDGSICYNQLPLLKKKVFTDKFYDKKKILNSLAYIAQHYNYDINLILEDIKEKYCININYDEVKDHLIEVHADSIAIAKVKRTDLINFFRKE